MTKDVRPPPARLLGRGLAFSQPPGPHYERVWSVRPNPAVAAEIDSLDAEKDCQRIAFLLSAYEFPFDMRRSLELALYHTYGSRSVANLLDRTGEFENRGQKRYDDTDLLIGQFIEAGWDNELGAQALTQMNKIHSFFDIPNDDFLFVLWTFIDFPIDWMKHYGWRAFSDHEALAWFNFWVRIGQLMGIEEIPTTKNSFDAFATTYENTEMVPNDASERVANATVAVMENWLPKFARGAVRPVASCVLREKFMRAARYSAAPSWLKQCVQGALRIRARVKRFASFGPYPDVIAHRSYLSYPTGRCPVETTGPEYAHAQAKACEAQFRSE